LETKPAVLSADTSVGIQIVELN